MVTQNAPKEIIFKSRELDLTAEKYKQNVESIAGQSIDGMSEDEVESAVHLAMFRFERMLTKIQGTTGSAETKISQTKTGTEKKVNRFGNTTNGGWYIQISFF